MSHTDQGNEATARPIVLVVDDLEQHALEALAGNADMADVKPEYQTALTTKKSACTKAPSITSLNRSSQACCALAFWLNLN